jgi:hypothetical protein
MIIASDFLKWLEIFKVTPGGGGNVPGSGIIPTQNLKMWLDAANPLNTGVVPNDGTVLPIFYDKSGNTNNAVFGGDPHANFFRNQLNGLPCVSLDGRNPPNQSYTIPPNLLAQANGMTLYAVYSTESSVVDDAALLSIGVNSSTYLEITPNASGGQGRKLSFANAATAASASFYNSMPASLTTPTCDTYIFGSPETQWSMNVNGAPQAITSAIGGDLSQPSAMGLTPNNYLGQSNTGANLLSCNIFEIILYSSMHTPAQAVQVQKYLLTKWGFMVGGSLLLTGNSGLSSFLLTGGGSFLLTGQS